MTTSVGNTSGFGAALELHSEDIEPKKPEESRSVKGAPSHSSLLRLAQNTCTLDPARRDRICATCNAGEIPVPPAKNSTSSISSGISTSKYGPRKPTGALMGNPCRYLV